jgi:hypothetical protein
MHITNSVPGGHIDTPCIAFGLLLCESGREVEDGSVGSEDRGTLGGGGCLAFKKNKLDRGV